MCRTKQSLSGDNKSVHKVINYSTGIFFFFFFSFFLFCFLFFGLKAIYVHLSPSSELTGALEFIDDFFLLYAPVLKPDCHLSLCQVCLRRYPSPFVFGDEFIGGIFSFQFLELHLGVWHTLLSPTTHRVVSTRDSFWKIKHVSSLIWWIDLKNAPTNIFLKSPNAKWSGGKNNLIYISPASTCFCKFNYTRRQRLHISVWINKKIKKET